MTATSRYIFCDIDGTLLHAPGTGRRAVADAFAEAFGILPAMEHITFAGATDILVLEQLMNEQNIPRDPVREQLFFDHLPRLLDRYLSDAPLTVFPGVEGFLRRVSTHWKLGLVTGNIRACAAIKLKYGGIDHFFDGMGGFGEDDGDRNRIAALALMRAGHPKVSYLLGDTPSDIEAARVNSMISVAVCNGQFDRAALERENPDIIVESFEDAEHLFQALDV